jgi:hypothetical protein
MDRYQPVRISTGLSLRGIFTEIILMKSGRTDSSLSETEAGPEQVNVKNAQIIRNVGVMDCITGKHLKKEYLFVTMGN